MVMKLDVEKPLFLGPEAVRENTTVDHIRRAVAALDTGEGVPYKKLEEYLLANYSPGKSANYSGSFIKSYVRDAVNKYNQLSHENGGHEYSVKQSTAKPKENKPKRVTKARQEQLEVLMTLRDRGEVTDVSHVDDTKITVEDLATATGKKRKTTQSKVEALEKSGEVRTSVVPGNNEGDAVIYVYLTPAGLAAVNTADPEGAESAPGASEGDAPIVQDPEVTVQPEPADAGDNA